MKYWIISDTHFYHKRISGYCNRPFWSVKQMNEEMIKRWNAKVCKNDIVFHLGDFCFGDENKIKEIRARLNGNIILIRGNHDKKITSDMGFTIFEEPITLGNKILSHYPLEDIPEGFINIHGHIHHRDSFKV